jgi:hypothetical protein
MLEGGDCNVSTDLGVRADERDAECHNPPSLTLPMPIPNCPSIHLSGFRPANLSTFRPLLDTYLSLHTFDSSISLFPTTSLYSPIPYNMR